MVDGDGLENRWARKGLGGSNPSPSANTYEKTLLNVEVALRPDAIHRDGCRYHDGRMRRPVRSSKSQCDAKLWDLWAHPKLRLRGFAVAVA